MTQEVGAVVSSLVRVLVEALEVILSFPGDLTGGEGSTKALISTVAAAAGSRARTYGCLDCFEATARSLVVP